MPSLDVHPIQSLNAEFGVPGDKSISHRAAILGGLANGTSTVRNFLPSEDCVNTLNAMRALGADVEILREHTGHGPLDIRIRGRAMALRQPDGPIDCGNSGTGMRLLAGVLAGQAFSSELFGDASLSSRPMGRITTPLGEMGARITTMGERPGCAPLAIEGTSLRPIHYDMPVASAQVKSAVLLAGLFADGATSVTQPVDTRDHTERLFEAFGILATRREQTIAVNGGQIPRSCDLTVPGDISSAAFWIAAAAAMPGSSIRIRNVGLNPTRTAILDVLSRMGATIRRHLHSDHGEPIGDLEIQGANLHGTDILPHEIPNLIDEIPVLAVTAAIAAGTTTIRNAAELRVKETDRITTVVNNLRLFNANVTEFDDGMEISGGSPLTSATIDSHGDHRIAMAFAIAGLFASGTSTITNTDCINTSYPGFARHLDAILNHHSDPADFEPQTNTPNA